MPLPAALAALSSWKVLGALFAGGMLGKSALLEGLALRGEHKYGKKKIALDTMLAKAQVEAARVENEANRRDTEKYLNMLRETRDREDIEGSRDRQMQLVMAMLGGLGDYRQNASTALVESRRTMPPLALTTLMRGM